MWLLHFLQLLFQPTRPLRGATGRPICLWIVRHFNPRAPCGARPTLLNGFAGANQFQPTRPLRGATREAVEFFKMQRISTHAPLAGRDFATTFRDIK